MSNRRRRRTAGLAEAGGTAAQGPRNKPPPLKYPAEEQKVSLPYCCCLAEEVS